MTDWAKFWWESITGPVKLINTVARTLRNHMNVCLFVPGDLPWRNEMRAAVEYKLRQSSEMENFDIEYIDVSDECGDILDIGRYLLKRYASPTVASGYRNRETIQRYLSNHRVLENRVLWVKGMTAVQEQLWIKFCRSYTPARETSGRFVLEVHQSVKDMEQNNLGILFFEEMINHYDLSLFNSLYLNTMLEHYAPIWQQYTSTLCASLCNVDAEISLSLMSSIDFCRQPPMEGLQKVARDNPRRGESTSEHILNLVRSDSTKKIDTRIWKAQLQVLFPLIELERTTFIERYFQEIKEALHTEYCDISTERNRRIQQFGEYIDDPNEVELGTIYRMNKLRRANDYYRYLLYIPAEASRTRLELLHTMRNALAHGEVCSYEQVNAFIEGHPFHW